MGHPFLGVKLRVGAPIIGVRPAKFGKRADFIGDVHLFPQPRGEVHRGSMFLLPVFERLKVLFIQPHKKG